jgi:hypothetical protein
MSLNHKPSALSTPENSFFTFVKLYESGAEKKQILYDKNI